MVDQSKLSKRAFAMWLRLLEGKYYPVHDAREYSNSPAMRELIAAGLVKRMARAPVEVSCFVPVGSTYRSEQIQYIPEPGRN